jgi:hypothetical protein
MVELVVAEPEEAIEMCGGDGEDAEGADISRLSWHT